MYVRSIYFNRINEIDSPNSSFFLIQEIVEILQTFLIHLAQRSSSDEQIETSINKIIESIQQLISSLSM